MIVGCTVATALVLFALRQNINLFYTPSQIVSLEPIPNHTVRLGGLVQKNSVEHVADDLTVKFIITDGNVDIPIIYHGILPNLFREGQGVIVQGKFNQQKHFIAEEVLAKHDENYRPPIMDKSKNVS